MEAVVENHPSADPAGSRIWPFAVAVGLSLVLAAVTWVLVDRESTQHVQADLAERARYRADALRMTLAECLMPLDAVASLRTASPTFDYRTYRAFVAPLKASRYHLNSIDWNPRVRHADRAGFEAAMRAEGFNEFLIRDRRQQGEMVPAQDRIEYYPVQYQEPIVAGGIALGFDLGSNPTRLEALARARDTGETVATGRIVLVEEADPSMYSLLVFRPVYRAGAANDTVAARRENLLGFAVGVVRVRDVLMASLGGAPPTDTVVSVYDDSAPDGEQSLDSLPADGDVSGRGSRRGWPTATERLTVGGRTWSVVVEPGPAFMARQGTWAAWYAAGAAFAATLLGSSFLIMGQAERDRVKRLVAVRTHELGVANAGLGAAQERLQRQIDALCVLTQPAGPADTDPLAGVRRIAEQAAHTLQVGRVGVWRLSADRSVLQCIALFDRPSAAHTTGPELPTDRFPNYMAALDRSRVIAAADAEADPRTAEFGLAYFRPLGVSAVLAVPLVVAGRVEGVLSAEHVGPKRPWLPDEQEFAIALANRTSLSLVQDERREAERRQRVVEDRLRLVWENSTDGLQLTDNQGVVVQVNPALCRLVGLRADQMIGRPAETLVAAGLDATPSGPAPRETRATLWDGRQAWFEIARSPLPAADPGPPLALTIYRDVTERKRQAILIEQTHRAARVGGWELDFRTDRLTWTDETYRIHEVDPATYTPTVETAVAFYAPEDVPVVAEAVRRGREFGESWEFELQIITAKGNRLWVHAVGRVEMVDGRGARAYGSFQDITARKAAEEAVRHSARQLRAAMAIGRMGAFRWEQASGTLTWSPELYGIYGIPDGTTMTFEAYTAAVHPDFKERVAAVIGRTLQTGEAFAHQYQIVRPTGEVRWVMARGDRTLCANGLVTGLEGVCQDITEQKQAEEAVRRLNEELEARVRSRTEELEATNARLGREVAERRKAEEAASAVSAFHEAIIRTAAEGICVCYAVDAFPHVRFTVWNERMTEITGYTQDEINRLGWYQSLYPDPDVRARAVERMAQMRVGNDLVAEEWTVAHRDGSPRTLAISTSLLDGPTAGLVVGLIQDVTQRKAAEGALLASEKKYRDLVETSHDLIWSVDADGRWTFVNRLGARSIYGCEPEEMLGRRFTEFEPPEQIEKDLATFSRLKAGQPVFHYESVHLRKDGGRVVLSFNAIPVYDGDGRVLGTTGSAIDITERRRAEDERLRTLNLLQAVTEGTQDAVFVKDLAGRYLLMNSAGAKILGQTADTIVGRRDADFLPPHLADRLAAMDRRVIDAGTAHSFEETIDGPDGRVTFWTTKAPYRDGQGRVAGVIGVARNMSERKQFEERLRESEERFRLVVESLPSAIVMVDTTGAIRLANAQAERWFGYRRDELIGQPVEVLVPAPYQAAHGAQRKAFMASPVARPMGGGRELFARRRDGSTFPVEIGLVPVETATGPMVLAAVVDITERKTAEAELREKELRLRQMAEASDEVFWLTAIEPEQMLYVSPAAEAASGIPLAEFYDNPRRWVEAVHPGDQERVAAEFDDWLSGRRPDFDTQYRIVRADGVVRWMHDRGALIRDGRGRPYRVSGVARDVTDYRAAQEQIAHRARLMEFGASVGLALTRGGDLAPMLHECADLLVRQLGGTFARIWTMNERDGVLELQASAGLYTHLDGPHARVPVGQFKIGLIAAEGKPHLTNDVLTDSRVSDPAWARREGMVAFAGYPLQVEGKVVGVIAMFARSPLDRAALDALAWVSVGIAQAIQRKRTQDALEASEQRYRAFVAQSTEAIWRFEVDPPVPTDLPVADQARRFLESAALAECNVAMARMYGYTDPGPLLGRPFRDFLVAADDKVAERFIQFALNGYRVVDSETREPDRHGNERVFLNNGVGVVQDGKLCRVWGTQRDVTERARAEIAIRASLREKEALLKEIHHRVKNNLQIISSLLSLQASQIRDSGTLNVFRESRNRVRSMALIHETLYRSGDLARVDLAGYVESVCAQLFRSYSVDPSRVGLHLEIETISLDLDRAIPAGLIINELVSNTLKYAFPGDRLGRIVVRLKPEADGSHELVVSDDGVGLPPDLNIARLDSLGLQLVADLTGQLRGTLSLDGRNGTTIRIVFPLE